MGKRFLLAGGLAGVIAICPVSAQAQDGGSVLYERDNVTVKRFEAGTCHLVSVKGAEFMELAADGQGVLSLWVRGAAWVNVPITANKEILWLNIPGHEATAIEASMRNGVKGMFQFVTSYDAAREAFLEPLRKAGEVTVKKVLVGETTFSFPDADAAMAKWESCIKSLPTPASGG